MAEHAHTPPNPLPSTRRNLLTGAAALAIVATAPTLAAADPDAALLHACAAHDVLLPAFNASNVDSDEWPHWPEYERILDVIAAAKPVTLAGMQAKARSAKAEALRPDGSEVPEGSFAVAWAWDLVNDLLAGAVA